MKGTFSPARTYKFRVYYKTLETAHTATVQHKVSQYTAWLLPLYKMAINQANSNLFMPTN
jgi:hypothetical protein